MSGSPLSVSTLKSLAFIEGIRRDVLDRVSGLSEEEALRVPDGSRNSVHWNLGHLLHVQLAHWYARRGVPLPLELGWKTYFREGKSPADYDADTPSWQALLAAYREFGTGLASKHGAMFEEPLTRPFDYLGTRFDTVDDGLRLLIFHEGEHFVIVKRILKAIGRA